MLSYRNSQWRWALSIITNHKNDYIDRFRSEHYRSLKERKNKCSQTIKKDFDRNINKYVQQTYKDSYHRRIQEVIKRLSVLLFFSRSKYFRVDEIVLAFNIEFFSFRLQESLLRFHYIKNIYSFFVSFSVCDG